MSDIYRLQSDVQKKECYTCKKERDCKCRTLEKNISCKYVVKPEASKIIRNIKRLF